MKNVRKFVTWDVPPLETLRDTNVYKIMEKLNNGEKLTRDEKNSICSQNGIVQRSGWEFNFAPYMKNYLVKLKYYGWEEYNAFDKTVIRTTIYKPSHIIKIVEI